MSAPPANSYLNRIIIGKHCFGDLQAYNHQNMYKVTAEQVFYSHMRVLYIVQQKDLLREKNKDVISWGQARLIVLS